MKIIKVIKIFYSIVTVVSVIFLVLLASLALLLGISGIDRENPKSIFGFRAFIVLTGSMNPEFDAGSMIIIREIPADMYKERDIITYRPLTSDDTFLTHRIVRIISDDYGTTFITRGDANNIDDPNPVPSAEVLGKVIFSRNGLGQFIVNLRTPIGLVIMVVSILVILFIIPYIIDSLQKNLAFKHKTYDGLDSEESAEDNNMYNMDNADIMSNEENIENDEDDEDEKDNL